MALLTVHEAQSKRYSLASATVGDEVVAVRCELLVALEEARQRQHARSGQPNVCVFLEPGAIWPEEMGKLTDIRGWR